MHIIQKHPGEQFFIGASILNVQQTGEIINLSNSTIGVVDAEGTDVTSTLIDAAYNRIMLDPDSTSEVQNVLACLLRAGTSDYSPYRVTFTMTTNMNHVWVEYVYVYVIDPE